MPKLPSVFPYGDGQPRESYSRETMDALRELLSEYDFAEPQEPARYSGKITTRVSPHIHRQAAMLAAEQGISLNQYISDAIVALNNQLIGIKSAAPAVEQVVDDCCRRLEQGMLTRRTKTTDDADALWMDYLRRHEKGGLD